MNLEDLTDKQITTKKMRLALKRNNTEKEVQRLSKNKNSNPDSRGAVTDISTNDDEITIDPTTI